MNFLSAALMSILALLSTGATAQSGSLVPLVFRISTENTPAHFQTRVVQRFANELARRTQGRMTVEFRHSAQLFRDQDVIRAITEGKVDMAVPGTWQLDRYDPYVSVLMLPMFLGRDAADHHRIRDGKLGHLISAHLEDALRVVVPGRWIDLGHANVYLTKQVVTGYQDMSGLRIRIAGGSAIAAQLAAVDAVPVVVSWPDLPNTLQRGRLDGLLTTDETVASARLWEQGIRHATVIDAYFAQYIPVISRSYWESLPEELRSAIRASWESIVDEARAEASLAQHDARRTLEAHGVRVVAPSRDVILAWRQRAVADQAVLTRKLGVPDAIVIEAQNELARGR
jgi:C4-dicarboxylate-binding protein DctP